MCARNSVGAISRRAASTKKTASPASETSSRRSDLSYDGCNSGVGPTLHENFGKLILGCLDAYLLQMKTHFAAFAPLFPLEVEEQLSPREALRWSTSQDFSDHQFFRLNLC